MAILNLLNHCKYANANATDCLKHPYNTIKIMIGWLMSKSESLCAVLLKYYESLSRVLFFKCRSYRLISNWIVYEKRYEKLLV